MLRRKIKEYIQAPIPHHLLMDVFVEYRRPNDKISQLIKSGELLSLRRGLYIPGIELDLQTPDLFVIANNLRGPSYISLESALSFWGLIPERVYEISSVTLKTSKEYKTPIGRFSFQHVASPYYSFGLQSIRLKEQQTAIIASKEKAICDKVILTPGVLLRSIRQTFDFLVEDLRIDEENLLNLDTAMMKTWLEDTPKRTSIEMLINTLESL